MRWLVVLTMAFAGAGLHSATGAQAQQPLPASPETSLSVALSAACRQDAAAFANFLTSDNAIAYRALPAPQRTALMKRLVLLEDPGRPLLSTSATGHPVVRCDAPGIAIEMRLSGWAPRQKAEFHLRRQAWSMLRYPPETRMAMRSGTELCPPAETCQKKNPIRPQNLSSQRLQSNMARSAIGRFFWIRAECCAGEISK